MRDGASNRVRQCIRKMWGMDKFLNTYTSSRISLPSHLTYILYAVVRDQSTYHIVIGGASESHRLRYLGTGKVRM